MLFFGLFGLPQISHAATIQAASCSYADVNAAVSAASNGDTVMVPPGQATWNTTLTITRGITLQGAGIGQTTITRQGNIISIAPNSTAEANSEKFYISGFTFDTNNASDVQMGYSGAINVGGTKSTRIIVHHNKFQNIIYATGVFASGITRGVVYQNQFDMVADPIRAMGGDQLSWSQLTQQYGTEENLFFEDNTMTYSSSMPYRGVAGWIETGQGGRIVVRYNTWNQTNAINNQMQDVHGLQNVNVPNGVRNNPTISIGSPAVITLTDYTPIDGDSVYFSTTGSLPTGILPFDYTQGTVYYVKHIDSTTFHISATPGGPSINTSGTQSGTHSIGFGSAPWCTGYSSMVVEVYGNDYQHHDYSLDDWTGIQPIDQRGGWVMYFNNALESSTHPSYYVGNMITTYFCNACQQTGDNYNQKSTNSYYWNNWFTGTDGTHQISTSFSWEYPGCPYDSVVENTDFFNYNASCNSSSCSSGVGCGSATPTGACTTGVGYWKTSQPCSNMTGMGGANPATPISGTLYKCTAPNTWTAYYTPYTYPHPLRVGADTTPPAAPTGLTVN